MNENIRYAGISTLTVLFPHGHKPTTCVHKMLFVSNQNSPKEIAAKERVWDKRKEDYQRFNPNCVLHFNVETKLYKIEGII